MMDRPLASEMRKRARPEGKRNVPTVPAVIGERCVTRIRTRTCVALAQQRATKPSSARINLVTEVSVVATLLS